jgi:hypothetical protein
MRQKESINRSKQLRITILGKARCVLLYFDSSKRCVCRLYKFLFAFKVVKLFLKHPVLNWRRMEKISWTDHARNEEVLLRVKEQRNILHEIRKGEANWIGHILRRNCILQRVIEGKINGG